MEITYGHAEKHDIVKIEQGQVIFVFSDGSLFARDMNKGIKGVKRNGSRPCMAFHTKPTNDNEVTTVYKTIDQVLHPYNRKIVEVVAGDYLSLDIDGEIVTYCVMGVQVAVTVVKALESLDTSLPL